MEYHRTWVYLADRFGMRIVGRVEPLPGIPPSARQLAELAELIRIEEVPVVVYDRYHSESPVEFLERETGVRIAVLPSSCEEPTVAAYFDHWERIVEILGGAEGS